jgi:hypothetical protein
MKKIVLFTILLFLVFLYAFQLPTKDKAISFLQSLDKEQRKITLLPFNDISKSAWHFIPGAVLPRAGIQLRDLNTNQKELFSILLQDYLSESGYDKAMRIMSLEKILAEISGDSIYRDSEKYSIAFYGDPEKDNIWAWSFEGHHLSLNFSIIDDEISMAPRFMGANPATIKEGKHKGERTLANEVDLAIGLMNSFTEEQRRKAIFQKESFSDIVTSNAIEVGPLRLVGISMKELNIAQQKILQTLIDEYISNVPAELAKRRMDKIKQENYDEIRFGWAGSIELNNPHYYRIQGKSFLIEFDNPWNNANHIHTVWRDFEGDFGRDLIQEHYQNSNHHND